MTSNRDKLAAIQIGDIVQFVWHVGDRHEVRKGIVAGWATDKYERRNLLVDDDRRDRETSVPLSSVISRRRVAGSDAGVISWHQEPEHATIGA